MGTGSDTLCFYVLRLRLKMSLGLTGFAVLLAGAAPYALGNIAFMAGPLIPEECGSWLAVMLVGVCHFSLAGAVLAGLDLIGVRGWIPLAEFSPRATRTAGIPNCPFGDHEFTR